MKKITTLISNNRIFFAGYFLFLLYFSSLLFFFSKADGFLLLNNYHNKAADWFFDIYTNVGDGLFSVAVFIILLLAGRKLLAIEVLLAYSLSGIVSQICKRFFATPRPKTFLLQHHIDYAYSNSIELAGNTSFPSGHTISAFALAAILSLNAKNKWMGLWYLIAAILVGYSRIYLGVHFPEDVLGGSVIGVITALLIRHFFAQYYKGNLK